MGVPQAVLAGGWIPFTVVVVVAFIFCWIYVRLFQHHSSSEVSSTITAIFALFVTLLTTALIPVDVFLVSFMKRSNGTFKDWAADNVTRNSIENAVTYTYYTLYGLVGLFIFILLPFVYFYYEERDDEDTTTKQRCCTAMKYSVVFLLIAIIILAVGAFVPLKMPPKNMTSFDTEFKFLEHQLESYTNAEKAMSMMVGILAMFGMLTLIMYTSYGMSALPFGMIRCCKGYKLNVEESSKRLTRKEKDEENARILRSKVRAGRTLSRFERNELRRIEQDERLYHKLERKKEKMKKNCCGKILLFLKPFEVVFGIVFMALALLLIVSLTITSIDKLKHSAGAKTGYALPKPTYPNPVNFVMMYAQKIFPCDYVLFTLIALYFIFASMNGIKRMGIWCCCIKMFKIRVRRTMPQGLLFMVFILMFTVVALNIVIFTISPQYVQYGNQQYIAHVANQNKTVLKACSTKAPEGECVMSRIATILNMLFYNAWFFGAYYYWSMWGFIGFFFLGLLVNIIRGVCCRKTEKDLLNSDDESDSDDDDEQRLIVA